jgi:D-alanyl-lipoteichoic acid acyltransferase DltB (MBOAT superfamily)
MQPTMSRCEYSNMLSKTHEAGRNREGIFPVNETRMPSRVSVEHRGSGIAPFLAVVLQFGLIVLVVNYWQLENVTLARVMQLAFVGFIIHHLLPMRLRLPFFAGLSLLAVVTSVGHLGPNVIVGLLNGKSNFASLGYQAVPGLTLIGIGFGLIAICHLPVSYGWRIATLVMVAAGLTVLRAKEEWLPDLAETWAILGSMFMFRLMIYLYDLKHRTAPFSPTRAVSYFFLLPNVCFPLFPLVDYKTFCATYYNEHWQQIYQSGARWMARGVFQLLLYRLVYQLAPLDVSQLSSSLDVAGFIVGTYLLYLRISGTFHLIVGLLHMFGFNLPETHHLYLLASSFTDFWRRINIYWKDFVMKLFFYPVHFRLRRLGMLRAMSVATLAAFFATWVLHAWQWYWIRGSVLLTWQDSFFWGGLGVLVLVNGLYEATAGKRRRLATSRLTLGTRLRRGLQTIITFIALCILWTIWSCQSADELRALMDAASRPSVGEIAIVLSGLAVLGLCAMIWGRSSRETSEGRSVAATRRPFNFWHSAVGVTMGCLCLLAVPSVATRLHPYVQSLVARLHGVALNTRDMILQRRG